MVHWHKPAQVAAAKSKSDAAKAALTSLDAYAALKNPTPKQTEQAINLLAQAIADLTRSLG